MTNFDDDDDSVNYKNKSNINSFCLLKSDNDLFNNDSYTPNKIIRIKLINNCEDWEIYEDNKTVLNLKGSRFTTAEKKYLKTIDGMKFLVSEYKSGTKSVNKFKDKLKQILNV